MHRLSLGAVKLTVLNDGIWDFPASTFFANVPEDRWHDAARPGDDGRIQVGHNCALVETHDASIIIDTGYGADTHDGRTGHLLEELERAGRRPEDITLVINTHAHGDHIKGNTRTRDGVRVPTFPNARYLIGWRDWQRFHGKAGDVHEFSEHIVFLDRLGKLVLVAGGELLTPEVRLLPTPGHTPGHVSVLIESAGRAAIFLGDVCHHPLHVSQPSWVTALDSHPEKTPRTRAALFELAAELGALVIFPHALPPGLGYIERSGAGFHWHAST